MEMLKAFVFLRLIAVTLLAFASGLGAGIEKNKTTPEEVLRQFENKKLEIVWIDDKHFYLMDNKACYLPELFYAYAEKSFAKLIKGGESREYLD